jgi:chromatin modification-related protein VID21
MRPQVNISQQQRTGTPMVAASNTRLSPQQLLQAQARAAQQQMQQQQLSQALAQAQQNAVAGGNATAGPSTSTQQQPTTNGIPVANNTHLSPNHYISRDATSSPAHSQSSPPRNMGTPSNAISPRPPSAQAITQQAHNVNVQAQIQMALQNGTAGSVANHYYVANQKLQVPGYTQEQVQAAVRAQLMVSSAKLISIAELVLIAFPYLAPSDKH